MKGKQIIYVPTHAKGNLAHPDVEYGFVTSYRENTDMYFCRFWSKRDPKFLRTTANSESVSGDFIRMIDTVPQKQVDFWIDKLEL